MFISAAVLSGLASIALWRLTDAGQEISPIRWVLGCSAGVWLVGIVHVVLRFDATRPRFIEVGDDNLYLARVGSVAFTQIVDWSLSPDATESDYSWLRITHKFGPLEKRWAMLLDNDMDISRLKEALEAKLRHLGNPQVQ